MQVSSDLNHEGAHAEQYLDFFVHFDAPCLVMLTFIAVASSYQKQPFFPHIPAQLRQYSRCESFQNWIFSEELSEKVET
jgi:hypothetical protein